MSTFDMPPASVGFPRRGRWLVDRLCRDLELTVNWAAGIVGNLGYESVGLAVLQEMAPVAGRGGYGWAQWTGPRRRAFETWCANGGLDPASDEANYGYLLVELRGAYAYVIEALHRTATLEQAVFTFGRLYEAPGGTTETHLPGFPGRLEWAEKALAGSIVAAQDAPQAPGVATTLPATPQSAPAASVAPPGGIDPDSDAEAEQLNAEELQSLGDA